MLLNLASAVGSSKSAKGKGEARVWNEVKFLDSFGSLIVEPMDQSFECADIALDHSPVGRNPAIAINPQSLKGRWFPRVATSAVLRTKTVGRSQDIVNRIHSTLVVAPILPRAPLEVTAVATAEAVTTSASDTAKPEVIVNAIVVVVGQRQGRARPEMRKRARKAGATNDDDGKEAWEAECDQHEPEGVVEHGFGYPLQKTVPIESMPLGGEESPLSGLYRMPDSQSSPTSSHMSYIDFEAVVNEYLSHYQNSDAQDMVFFVEADAAGAPLEMSTSLILQRVKLRSIELALLRALNTTEIRSDPWNPAPRLLHTAECGDDAVLYLERLFDCDHPPLQTVANVVDYIRQALEHKIARCAYGDPNGVMMDIGRSSSAGPDRTRLPMCYYRVNVSRVKELPREADPRSKSFCRDVCDCDVPESRCSSRR
ncbi:hypothetical protein EDB85DRAFT_2146293 [Lactarius pseudohatsudake]|nr:hypothetical protein EDB85DRAFT_2146293 [Lactarius pseudohatsudake]